MAPPAASGGASVFFVAVGRRTRCAWAFPILVSLFALPLILLVFPLRTLAPACAKGWGGAR